VLNIVMSLTPDTLPPATAARAQLRDDAAAHIRELIISGQAAPGTLLRLGPLAERVGASITPVREALLLLTQDGWLVQEPHRGFRVAPIHREDVDDAYLVQSFVAGELAARAAENATEEAIRELRRLDAEIAALDVRHDYQHVEDMNYRLHGNIYDLAESPRLVWFVRAASRFVPRRFWATIPGWLDLNRSGHGPVIDALESGDRDRARELMATHIRTAGELLVAHLESIGSSDESEEPAE
jgi:DNA-binding GntR family transcriptional regulator